MMNVGPDFSQMWFDVFMLFFLFFYLDTLPAVLLETESRAAGKQEELNDTSEQFDVASSHHSEGFSFTGRRQTPKTQCILLKYTVSLRRNLC